MTPEEMRMIEGLADEAADTGQIIERYGWRLVPESLLDTDDWRVRLRSADGDVIYLFHDPSQQ